MKKNFRRTFPWIPIVGIILTLKSNPDNTKLFRPSVFWWSATHQAVCVMILVFLLNWLFLH